MNGLYVSYSLQTIQTRGRRLLGGVVSFIDMILLVGSRLKMPILFRVGISTQNVKWKRDNIVLNQKKERKETLL